MKNRPSTRERRLLGSVGSALSTLADTGWMDTAWPALERLGPGLVGQIEEPAILRVALAHSAELLRCDLVEVVLDRPSGGPGLVARARRGTGEVVIQELARPDGGRTDPSGEDPAPAAVRRGQPSVAAVPLTGAGDRIGMLSAHGGRPRERRTRLRLMSALGHVLSSSIAALRMYQLDRVLAEQLYRSATTDHLTGLGTRSRLLGQGDQLLARAAARGTTAALLMMDLDGFKWVNDTLGHAAGAVALAEIGHRLRMAMRPHDLVVRLGGDEFALLVADLADASDVGGIADRLLATVRVPVRVGDVEVAIGGSLGVALHPDDGETVQELLKAADEAMYLAKQSGPGQWHWPPAHGGEARQREASLSEELRDGIPDDQLCLHYQPQVDARTGEVVALEALARWQHPVHGLVPPEMFLPAIERHGLMRAFTRAVIGRGLSDLNALADLAPHAAVSVNITPRNLLDAGLAADVGQLLRDAAVPGGRLTLEVTEPGPTPSTAVTQVLDAMAGLGCTVSIHEYGSGVSSLTTLSRHTAVREVKVAPPLAAAVLDDPGAARVVRALVSAARELGMRVVAEGVESSELAVSLTGMGCDRLQGFGICPPSGLPELRGWLEQRGRSVPLPRRSPEAVEQAEPRRTLP